jgi:SynChlorMet cassette radical SAM/SPASM protein ScmF
MHAYDPTSHRYPLRSIYFYPTESCNLRCIHCWVNPGYAPDPETYRAQNQTNVSVDSMAGVIRQALPLGLQHIKLTGGEPLLSPLFFDYLACFDQFDLDLSVETNATLIDDATARRLRRFRIRHISTSLDGSRAAVHEGIRRKKGCFDLVLRGIRALSDNGFAPQVIFCLQQANAGDLEDTIRLARQLNVTSFEINPLTLFTNGNGGGKASICRGLKIEQLLSLQQQIEDDYPSRFPGIRVNLYLPPALKGIRALSAGSLCSCRIFNICGILSNGDVSVCGIGRRNKALVMGNVTTDPLARIWHEGRLFEEIRRQVPRHLKGVCGRCLFRYHCLGFCRADTLFDNQTVLEPNVFCQKAYRRGLFPESRLLESDPDNSALPITPTP